MQEQKFGDGFDLKEVQTQCSRSVRTSVPVLIIHGDKDKTAPVSMRNKLQ